jgi:uncharacterized membrane protein YfcA
VLSAAFFAGFVDAIVGGGGLIQLPALLAGYPSVLPPQLLGTNKLGSICGTLVATLRYQRTVSISWRRLLPATGAAGLAAFVGANCVRLVSPRVFRPLVPVMLSALLIYVLVNKDLGSRHLPLEFSRRRGAWALFGITIIGFYDGFFGPGTGSFLMLLFVKIYGFDFLRASASARMINVATNAGALLLFGALGQVSLAFGLALGACNAAGSVLGTHAAVKHGSGFIRVAYIVIVSSLIAKTAWDVLR